MADMEITRPTKSEPMKLYNIRVPASLWRDASAQAKSEGIGLSELIRHWLTQYVRQAAERDTD